MTALQKLQGSMLFQAASSKTIASALSSKAKAAVAAGVLVAIAAASAPEAQAQNRVFTPSACAALGGAIGAAAGAVGARGDGGYSPSIAVRQMAVGGLGALAGSALGSYLCDDTPKPGNGTSTGTTARNQAGQPIQQGVALSFDERSRMDILLRNAVTAKDRWMGSMLNLQHVPAGWEKSDHIGNLRKDEAKNRADFELLRQQLYVAVHLMHQANISPRDIARYSGVLSAFMELPTEGAIDYRMVVMQEQMLRRYNTQYQQGLGIAASVPYGQFTAQSGQAPRFVPATPAPVAAEAEPKADPAPTHDRGSFSPG